MRTKLTALLIAFQSCAMLFNSQAQLTRQANTTLTLPANLPSPTGYSTSNAFGTLTFSSPICIVTPPGETNRVFIVEKGGTIQIVENITTTPTKRSQPFMNIANVTNALTIDAGGESGLLSMAFHPNYATNRQFYIFYSLTSTDGKRYQRIARLKTSTTDPNAVDNSSLVPMITQLDQASNHNGGDMAFGADGYLYISTGDEGDGNDSLNNARFINKDFYSAIFRIDVDNLPGNLTPNAHSQSSTDFPSAIHTGTYRIPADNPFIGFTSWHNQTISASTVRTEIWATGLRNPWRMSFDAPSGRLFVGDVGQGTREEVDIIAKGKDYGWSWREGTFAFTSGPSPTSPPAQGFNPTEPIYGRSGAFSGSSITGGVVYRGNNLTELYGAYIFADYGSGKVWALKENNGVWAVSDIASRGGIVEFGFDPSNGDVLMCDINGGVVRRLTRSGTTGTAPSATLSGTGAFSNLTTLTPNTGIVPYAVNQPFWSDYATKQRWFAIKNLTDTIGLNAEDAWTSPTGMVWVKHFEIETVRGNPNTRRKLETRFLVKTATEIYGITYRWRADQTEADLVPEQGSAETLSIEVNGSATSQTWRYPSRSECRACHTQQGGFTLSFNTRQLNRLNTYGAQTLNQITALSNAGYLSSSVSNVNTMPAHPALNDTSASLEARVRAYLAINCSMCHQPGGAGLGNWDGRITTLTDAAGIINGTLFNTGGDAANRFVVPGDTSHSMLLKRLQGSGAPRMPPVTLSVDDAEAIAVITDWINNQLPSRQNFPQWQVANFGSTNALQAVPSADPDGDGITNAQEFLLRSNPNQSTAPILPSLITSNGQIDITFTHPANRTGIIESSLNMQNWSLWNVPNNNPTTPATDILRTLTAPLDGTARFFRLKLSEY
jgi:uncharacterized repeat protein (TIGR03806 family)